MSKYVEDGTETHTVLEQEFRDLFERNKEQLKFAKKKYDEDLIAVRKLFEQRLEELKIPYSYADYDYDYDYKHEYTPKSFNDLFSELDSEVIYDICGTWPGPEGWNSSRIC